MEYKYAESHEWVKVDGDVAYVGISEHAQHELGDIVYVELPETGSDVAKGEEVSTVESVKAAAAILSPVSGSILTVNEELGDVPEKINQDAMGTHIFSLKLSDPAELDSLMDETAYAAYIEENQG